MSNVKLKGHQKLYLPIKRLIDFIGSLIGILVCFSLLWWWIFIVNLFVTKGHPIFAQVRVGKNGKTFKLLKFRTMPTNVNPNMTAEEARTLKNHTGFGKFLRKSSLDETLQLLNIFIGKMAFIGPRPLIYHSLDKITIDLRKENGSIMLRPGLSGYAQINGRTFNSPEKKAELDLYYLNHISFWLDIKLFILSIFKAIN